MLIKRDSIQTERHKQDDNKINKFILHAYSKQKKDGIAILVSDKMKLKSKLLQETEEGHYILIKGSIHQEDIAVTNIYIYDTKAPKYMRQEWQN